MTSNRRSWIAAFLMMLGLLGVAVTLVLLADPVNNDVPRSNMPSLGNNAGLAHPLDTRGAQPQVPYPVDTSRPQSIPHTVETTEAMWTKPPPTPSPTRTPIPHRTPMPPGWEPLARLAAPWGEESYEAGDKRVQELYQFLKSIQGTIIAQSTTVAPSCISGPHAYRIEEIRLPGPVRFDFFPGRDFGTGESELEFTTDRYWRVAVTGGPFVGQLRPHYIWIDHVLYNSALEISDIEISAIYFRNEHVYEGSTIGLRYGVAPADRRIDLLEKIHFADGRPEQSRLVPAPYPTLAAQQQARERATIDAQPPRILPPEPAVSTAIAQRLYEEQIFLEQPGKTLAQSSYPILSCQARRENYQLEEVNLPQPVTFENGADGKSITTNKFWRLYLSGVYPTAAGGSWSSHWALCVDNTPLRTFPGWYANRQGLVGKGGLIGITFDRSILRDSASIFAASYTNGPISMGFHAGLCSSDAANTPQPRMYPYASDERTAPIPLSLPGNPNPVSTATPHPIEIACQKEDDAYAMLHSQPGQVIARGQNSVPTCFLGITTYRVEEVTLPRKTGFELEGKRIEVERYWRITVYGTQFREELGYMSIWLGDTQLAVTKVDGSQTAVTALLFDGTLLREGATIGFTFVHPDERESLPEKLHMSVQP